MRGESNESRAEEAKRDASTTVGHDRADGSTTGRNRRRGQANVLGVVLLVGMVVTGSVALLLVGAAGLDAYEASAEVDQAERSLLEFTHATHTATADGGERVPVSTGAFERGTVETSADAGRLRIVHETDSGTEELYDESLGTVRYTADGDTELAYQGGGLWRTDGAGTAAVSPPPIEYRDGTLTVPVVRVAEGQHHGTGASLDGAVRQAGPPTHIDLQRDGRSGAPATGTVRLEIESEYCDGWEREVEASVPGRVTERCTDGHPGRVQFEFGVPPRIGVVESAIIAHEIEFGSEANRTLIEGDVRTGAVDEDRVNGTVFDAGYDAPSVDAAISGMVDRCTDDDFGDLPEKVDEPGRYCVDSIDGGHTVDTSAGDIEVVVRDSIGDPTYKDELRVEGSNTLTLYVDGDLKAGGNAVIGNESDPGRTRLLLSANSTVATGTGTPALAGLLYAPDSTVTLQGDPTVDGSVVGERIVVPNNNPGVIEYDDRIAAVDFVPGSDRHLRDLDATAYDLAIEE